MDIFSQALYEGGKPALPYIPFVAPKLREAPWALQDPARKRAIEAEKARQKRNSAKTSFLDTGKLALAYLRYIISGDLAGAWTKFGGLGALLTNLASAMELSMLQNMETACRFERAQGAAWNHLARERGGLQITKDELVRINRGRLQQVATDQVSEFNDRYKKREGGNPGSSTRPRARNRRSRSPRRSPRWAKRSTRRREYQPRSPRDPKDTKSTKYNNSSEKKQDDKKPEPKNGEKTSSDFALVAPFSQLYLL